MWHGTRLEEAVQRHGTEKDYVLAGSVFHEFTAGVSEVAMADMAEVPAFL